MPDSDFWNTFIGGGIPGTYQAFESKGQDIPWYLDPMDLTGNRAAAAREAEAMKAGGMYGQYAQKAINEYQQAKKQGRSDLETGWGGAMGLESPYYKGGLQAEKTLEGTLNLPGSEGRQTALDTFRESPRYKFMTQQGEQAIQRQQAAQGLGGSGAEQKALMKYGSDLADTTYGQYQDRLGALAGRGQQMAETMGGQTLGTGQNLANLGRGYAEDIGGAYQGMGASYANALMAGMQGKQSGLSSLMPLAGAAAAFL